MIIALGVSARRYTRTIRQRGDESGYSLVELIIATFILSVAILALASVALSTLSSLRITRDREQAVNAASAAIEDVRSRDFAAIAHAPGSIDIDRVPPGQLPEGSSDTCVGDEPIVEGAVDDPVPFESTTGNLGRITVHIIVTRTQDEDDDPCEATGDLKRVRAIASWTDGGTQRALAQETLIADAGRGLPVPSFEIVPEARTLVFTEAFIEGGGDLTQCVAHELRNRGAEDGYDWQLLAQDPVHDPRPVESDGYTYESFEPDPVGWNVSAYLEYREDDDLPLPNHGTEPPDPADRMTVDPAAATPRPTSDIRIEATGEARLTFCYEPEKNLDAALDDLPVEMTLQAVVRSRFDERVERHVTHTLRIIDQSASDGDDVPPGVAHFLFNDRIEDMANPDDQPRRPDGTNYVPDVLATSQRSELLDEPLPDWSDDMGDGEAGVALLEGADFDLSANTATWHYQFGSRTTVLANGTLRLWVSPPEGAGGDPEMGLGITIDRLNNQEDTDNPQESVTAFQDVYPSETFDASPTVVGDAEFWMVDIPVELGESMTFNSGRYLRLRVTCTTDGNEDCLIAYDHEAFPSALYLEYE